MPARLSAPNEPIFSTTSAMSASVTSRSRSVTSLSGNRASGTRPRSSTTSMSADWLGRAWIAATISGGSAPRSASRSSINSRVGWSAMPSPSAERRQHGRLGDADERLFHEERDGGDVREPFLLHPVLEGGFVGPDRGDDAVVVTVVALLGPGADHAQAEPDEGRRVGARTDQHPQVVRLVLLRHAH